MQTTTQDMMIDPPGGWCYGFPKRMPAGTTNVEAWMIEQGYPKHEVEYWFERGMSVPYRSWVCD